MRSGTAIGRMGKGPRPCPSPENLAIGLIDGHALLAHPTGRMNVCPSWHCTTLVEPIAERNCKAIQRVLHNTRA